MELIIKNKTRKLVKELPEKMTISDAETIVVNSQRSIITRYENDTAVGFTADVSRRVFSNKNENTFSVTENRESVGEFVFVEKDSSIDDIIEAINNLVDIVESKIVGKDI